MSQTFDVVCLGGGVAGEAIAAALRGSGLTLAVVERAALFRGDGTLADLRTIAVAGEQLVARRAIVIANGSTAAIPPIPGLDTVDYWTNRQATVPTLGASLSELAGKAALDVAARA